MNTRLLIALLCLAWIGADAREYPRGKSGKNSPNAGSAKLAAACSPGAASTDLDLNNVRALIYTSGDMWWDHISTPRYEVPKGSGKHSAFAASLWLGGLDNGGNLKAAAMTYRSRGNDFWPGPLKLEDASVTGDVCLAYDRHWKITRREVEDFVLNGQPATDVILNWPGNGIRDLGVTGFANEIAPFVDGNGDGEYTPELRDSAGNPYDFPAYDIAGELGCKARLFGDQTLWYVFNDKGNIHSETGAFPFGFEIRAQAFQFATNNALNNMTFYNYEIINRSTFTVTETYFGYWGDPDLGNYADDYAGCDVGRGFGYVYNGDDDDETVQGYGLNPPAIGIDYFEGPYEDKDGLDNDGDYCVNPRARNGLGYGDGIIDNERIGMVRFAYYNADGSITGEPNSGQHIYNYLRGLWKDGTPMVYGGNGYGAGDGSGAYSFMFPGDTDPEGLGYMLAGTASSCREPSNYLGRWDEASLGLAPADRRTLQSAGPFTLDPGAVNMVTVGVVWARASAGGPLASVEAVRRVDDDAQALFENCFSLINGPDAPQTKVVELDKEIILLFENTNNKDVVQYEDKTAVPGFGDVTYRFQGYQIYQLKDLNTTVNDLDDVSRARLIAQVDIQDSITQVVNSYYDPGINARVPVSKVNGENKGLRNSFRITTDAFAAGDNKLVNHKRYYYLVLSYSVADVTDPEFGEKYLAGRRTKGFSSLQVYTAIPHINSPEFGGAEVRSEYGEIPPMTRIEGQGNGENFVDLSAESIEEILRAPYFIKNPVYLRNAAPVNVRVADPLSVPKADFEFRMLGLSDTARWSLTNLTTGETYLSTSTIGKGVEEVISNWGFAVTVNRVPNPGIDKAASNGFIGASLIYEDNTRRWLDFVPDEDGCDNPQNWIRSGTSLNSGTQGARPDCNDYGSTGAWWDERQVYERVLGGTWAPFQLTSRWEHGPCLENATLQSEANLAKLSSVDIVLTPDKSKWSRCPVFETGDHPQFSEGGVQKLSLRAAPSVDKEGRPDGTGTGMGWFPGYAINVATGERLNIAFGESSRLTEDNGRDMKFNPSSRAYVFSNGIVQPVFGGKHYIYVFNHAGNGPNDVPRYDEGEFIRQRLSDPTTTNKRFVFKDCGWVSMPLAVANQEFLSNPVKISLRVTRQYAERYNARDMADASEVQNNNNPMYRFSTDDIYTRKNELELAKSALDLINVVPNPYYAYSAYERNQVDNRIKITNLPKACKIRIYTTNGTLIRTFDKDDPMTSLDWDLKNQVGVTVSSGIYLIHVNVEGVGEKIIKWFGVLRPIDLDSF